MIRKVITDNIAEKIEVSWDGERFSISLKRKLSAPVGQATDFPVALIILNPREILDIIDFVSNLGGTDGHTNAGTD